jgi:hypothetical protein
MPQVYDMGPTGLRPLRRKVCCGFFRPEKNQAFSAGFEPPNLGTRPPKRLVYRFVVVAVIVDWFGFLVFCDVYWFFHGWRHLRKECCCLYVEYDLSHTGVHLLCLCEFWIRISAWWLCWICRRNPTVLFRVSQINPFLAIPICFI